MTAQSPEPSNGLANESPSRDSPEPTRQSCEEQVNEAKVVFNKTIEGHYRHGRTGYKQVGALFLTWKDDDMHCKESEVDRLRQLFTSRFHFQTHHYEIPSEKWETALHLKLAQFCHDYDSPEDLAIIYYGGHGYLGTETKKFKLAAKIKKDGSGDPIAFFDDIQTCLRLPACDQLMIMDCCYAANAFAREHIGKRKFELMTSAAHDKESPAPKSPQSFTKTLNDALERLLDHNPKGVCTSQLYREVYHTVSDTKPFLFDQARHSYGKIWLRPQTPATTLPTEEGRYLKLTLRLNENPDGPVMNELALQLQYLPHVDQIRFEGLHAPKKQIADFMRFVECTKTLKPLIKKLQKKRQLRKLANMKKEVNHNEIMPPDSLLKLRLAQNHRTVYDWTSAVRDDNPKYSEYVRDQRKKTMTWPPEKFHSSSGASLNREVQREYVVETYGPGKIVTSFVPRRVNTEGSFSQRNPNASISGLTSSPPSNESSSDAMPPIAMDTEESAERTKRQRVASPDQMHTPAPKSRKISHSSSANGNQAV